MWDCGYGYIKIVESKSIKQNAVNTHPSINYVMTDTHPFKIYTVQNTVKQLCIPWFFGYTENRLLTTATKFECEWVV